MCVVPGTALLWLGLGSCFDSSAPRAVNARTAVSFSGGQEPERPAPRRQHEAGDQGIRRGVRHDGIDDLAPAVERQRVSHPGQRPRQPAAVQGSEQALRRSTNDSQVKCSGCTVVKSEATRRRIR